MFIFLEFPALLLPPTLWGPTSAGAAWETVEPEAVPRIPLQDLPPRILFQVSVPPRSGHTYPHLYPWTYDR